MASIIKRGLRKVMTPLLWNCTSAEMQCAIQSFSQFGEDVMCGYLFENGFRGFYVDVGAFHPMLLSNSYKFYQQGWNGLSIDANPEVVGLFQRFRPRERFIHSAVGDELGTIEMALFKDGAFNCTLDQLHKVPERLRHQFRQVSVPVKPLAKILEEEKVKAIDFLNIDCEGNDLKILCSNDWSRWRPRVVCVEDHALDWQKSEIADYLESQGYALKFRAVFSSIFCLNEMAATIQADSLA